MPESRGSTSAAGDLILQQAIDDDEAWTIVLPALFLYRHAIELRLKSIVSPTKLQHNLSTLVDAVNRRFFERCAKSLPLELIARITEIDSWNGPEKVDGVFV